FANRTPRPLRRASVVPSSGSRPSASGDGKAMVEGDASTLSRGPPLCREREASPRRTARGDSFKGPLHRPEGTGFGQPQPTAAGRKLLGFLWRVHAKLNGCGTHIEHIVSVHDLFRRVSWGRHNGGNARC